MLRKNVKSLLEQLQVCIFAEIVFGVRCTLNTYSSLFVFMPQIQCNESFGERGGGGWAVGVELKTNS